MNNRISAAMEARPDTGGNPMGNPLCDMAKRASEEVTMGRGAVSVRMG